MLLEQAGIPFQTAQQAADEQACDWNLPLEEVVASIARFKMEHVILPGGNDGDSIFVVTGDTLSQDNEGGIKGKPKDRQDAIKKIKEARAGSSLCSAFCLDKKIYRNGAWQTEKRIEKVVCASYVFNVPDRCIDEYLSNTISMKCDNAVYIEGYGTQFLKEVHGSYSTIIGLPMFELREALEQMGFFN